MIYPLEALSQGDFKKIVGFYYNPNIHPYGEYLKRRKSVERFALEKHVAVFVHKHDMRNFFRSISGNEELGKRCHLCWWMRLEETAHFASQNGFTHFSTTLLVSPYQDQGAIRAIGEEVGAKHGVQFVFEDFRSGFRQAQDAARTMGLYRQKYCGCVFSEQERFDRKKTKKF